MTHDVGLTAATPAALAAPGEPAQIDAPGTIDPDDVTAPDADVTITSISGDRDAIPTRSMTRPRLGLLGEHDFRQLFIADSGSQLGTQIGMLALPLVAAVTLHATAFEMGVVSAADTLPFLLASLPAGALVDRVRRRPVMIACDLARAATLISIPLAWWLGALAIWQVVVVAFVLGTFSAVFDVAYQSVLPHLVAPDQLVEGNSKLQAVAAVSQIGGPAAAGFVIRALTAPVAVGVNAVTYVSSAVFLGRIRTREIRPERAADRHFGRDIVEGLRFVGTNSLLRAIAAEAGSSNFFSAMSSAMLIYLLAHTLGVNAGVIGVLLSIASVGGLVGAMSATVLARRVGEGRILWLSLAVTSPFMVGVPLMRNDYTLWLAAAAFTVAVAGAVAFSVTSVSFRQRLAPPRLLGRVNATMRFLVIGAMPLGGLLGGALGTWLGVRPTLWIATVGSMLAFLPAFFSPLRSMRTLPSGGRVDAATAETANV
jgi:MFS family permease